MRKSIKQNRWANFESFTQFTRSGLGIRAKETLGL
jgi:hypothetical protein